MDQDPTTEAYGSSRLTKFLLGFGVLLIMAVIGLFYVKWGPYFHKSFVAAADHSLGSSIVSGKSAAPPEASFSAAVDYSIVYFKAIWKALVLALVLAATVEVLVPRDWLSRLLGRASAKSSFLGGVLALPGMM